MTESLEARPRTDGQDHSEEIRRLEALVATYRSAARLHGMRADGLGAALGHQHHVMSLWQRSLAWRVTFPLRVVRAASKGRLWDGTPLRGLPARLRALWARQGFGLFSAAIARVTRPLRARMPQLRRSRAASGGLAAAMPVATAAAAGFGEAVYLAKTKSALPAHTPVILIIAELSLRQCAKYRVWQRQEMLERAGWRVQVVDWRDTDLAMSALQWCGKVIFYRTPGFDSVMRLVAEAHRLELAPWWEVDDLIFDAEEYRQNGNLGSLTPEERDTILFGVKLFRACMLACGRTIASTQGLAEAMRGAGIAEVAVIENALDAETMSAALDIAAAPPTRDAGRIVMIYGSGTNTHDADFREAAAGIAQAMTADSRLCLRIVGELTVPKALLAFGDRVETIEGMPYRDYLRLVAQADIALAPLEKTRFNDSKSNIKLLEAASVGVPTVCSPRAAFRVILREGVNGYGPENAAEWCAALLALASSAEFRQRMGEQARTDVKARYAPDAVRVEQVAPVFGVVPTRKSAGRKLNIMAVNVYFEPRSFGGATLVAEEMIRRLRARDADFSVFTSRPHLEGRSDSALRYAINGVDVLAGLLPPDHDQVAQIDNPKMADFFRHWLETVRPDVVHVHALQGLGTGLLRVCQAMGIPYVITLHDAWWVCERQFMVKANGQYCFQTKIALSTCAQCIPGARHLADRAQLMAQAMDGAALLISPSNTHRDLYLANGIAPERIVVNKNGFAWPSRPRAVRPKGTKLRFGFVGGTEAVKGFPLIKAAFEGLERSDWELVLVDNKLNLGFRSLDVSQWDVEGKVTIVPAYTRETIDDFFDGVDVMLFPSQWKESYGLTVREALVRDVWVIATAPGGQAEDVRDGVNGTLIPLARTKETLSGAIEALLDAPERFEQGYVNAFKDDLPNFDSQADELLGYLTQAARSRANAS